MYREVLRGLLIACILLSPWSGTGAQPARPAAEAPEIKLDEQTTLKATALEARMAAVVACLCSRTSIRWERRRRSDSSWRRLRSASSGRTEYASPPVPCPPLVADAEPSRR